MREIKFRAWDPVAKKMFVPEFIDCEFGELWFDDDMAGESNLGPYPNKPIVMQYTGLHDKNGKEIYEGDVIRYTDDLAGEDLTGEVFCSADDENPGEWVVVVKGGFRHPFGDGGDINIIGNIYENPELVK